MTTNNQYIAIIRKAGQNWKQVATAINIAAISILILALSSSKGQLLNGFHASLVKLNLCGLALASLGLAVNFKKRPAIKHAFILMAGFLAIMTGLIFPISSPFGAAFPSCFLTAGISLIATDCARILSSRSKRKWVHDAWGEMTFMLTLLPITISVVVSLLIAFDWSLIDAIPAGFVTSFFVNPLAAYWRTINRTFI